MAVKDKFRVHQHTLVSAWQRTQWVKGKMLFSRQVQGCIHNNTGKMLELDWSVPSHLPYLPDFSPNDYYLVQSLKSTFTGKTFL